MQRGVLVIVNELMNEGIKETLDFKSPCSDSSNICTFRIADFGCSAGPNTFLAMEKIIEAVEQKYHAQFQNSPPLEFQVFFNDVTANDFNTLFKTLPSYQNTLLLECLVLFMVVYSQSQRSVLHTLPIPCTGSLGFQRKSWTPNLRHGIRVSYSAVELQKK
jgi:hypothetical protein